MNPLTLQLAEQDPLKAALSRLPGAGLLQPKRPTQPRFLQPPQFFTLTEAKARFAHLPDDARSAVGSFLFTRMVDPEGGRQIGPVEPVGGLSRLRVPEKALREAESLLKSEKGLDRILGEVEQFRTARTRIGTGIRSTRGRTPGPEAVRTPERGAARPEPIEPGQFGQTAEQAERAARGRTPGFGRTAYSQPGTMLPAKAEGLPEVTARALEPLRQLALKAAEYGKAVPGPVGAASQLTEATEGRAVTLGPELAASVLENFRIANTTDDPAVATARLAMGAIDVGLLDQAAVSLPAKAFKLATAKAALRSGDLAAKQAALKVAKAADGAVEEGLRQVRPMTAQQQAAKAGVSLTFRPDTGAVRGVEKAAEREGVRLGFRKPRTVEPPVTEFKAPGYGFRTAARTRVGTAFHGTTRDITQGEPVLFSTTVDRRTAAEYAHSLGGIRKKSGDLYITDTASDDGAVFKKHGDEWFHAGYVDENGKITLIDKPVKPSLTQREAERLVDQGTYNSFQGNATLVEVEAARKPLDLTTQEGVEALRKIEPSLFSAADRTFNWSNTKFANVEGHWQNKAWKKATESLKEAGYDGIKFNDDTGETIATFGKPRIVTSERLVVPTRKVKDAEGLQSDLRVGQEAAPQVARRGPEVAGGRYHPGAAQEAGPAAREVPQEAGVGFRFREPRGQGRTAAGASTGTQEPVRTGLFGRPRGPQGPAGPPRPTAEPAPPESRLLESPKLAEIGRVRKELGLPQYTKDRKPWDDVIKEAVEKKLHTKGEALADDVLAKGRLLNEPETVAVGMTARNLQHKLNRLYTEKAKFVEAGNMAEADLAQRLIDEAQERFDKVTTALSKARSRTGGTLNIGKIVLPSTYDEATLRARATAHKSKGAKDAAAAKLTADESAQASARSKATESARQTYEQAEARWVKARVTAALRGIGEGGQRFGARPKVERGAFSDDAAEKALQRLRGRGGGIGGPRRTQRGAAYLPVDEAEALITVMGNRIAKGVLNADALAREAKSIVAGLDDAEAVDAIQEALRRVRREKGRGASLGEDVFAEGDWAVQDADIATARKNLAGMARTISDQFYDPGIMLDRVTEMQRQLDRLESFVAKGDKAQAEKVREELRRLGAEFNKGIKEGEEFLQSGEWAVMDKEVAEARRRWQAMMADTDAWIASLEPTDLVTAARAAGRAWGFTNVVNRFFDLASNTARAAVEGAGKPVDKPLERLLFPRLLGERQSAVGGLSLRRGRQAAQGYWRRVGERIVRQATSGESRALRKIGAPRSVNVAARFQEGTAARKAARAFDATVNALNRLPGYTDIPTSQWVEDVTLQELAENLVRFEAKGKGWTPEQVALKKADVIANVDGKYDDLYSAALEEANRAVYTHDSWIDGVVGSAEAGLNRTLAGRNVGLVFDTFITRYPRIFAKIADYATDFVGGAVKAGVRAGVSASKAKAARKAGEAFEMPLHEQRLITQLVRRNMQGAAIVALGTFAYSHQPLGTLDSKKQFIDHGDLENLGGPFALFLAAHDHAMLKDLVGKGELTEKQAQKIEYQTWVNIVANQPLLGEADRALGALTRGEGVEKFVAGKLSNTLFPGILREAARRTDGVRIRETKDDSSLQTILNEFKKNVPGLRQQLPERGAEKAPSGERKERTERKERAERPAQ